MLFRRVRSRTSEASTSNGRHPSVAEAMTASQVDGGSRRSPRDALAALTGTLDDPRCSLAGEEAGRIRATENDPGGFGLDRR